LTAIPFYLVMTKAASPSVLLPTILLIGAVQMVVHIKYFLHLGDAANGAWNYTALGLTTLIVAIVVIGSLWVMLELNRNMMPWMFDDSGQMHMQSQTPGDAEGMVPGMKM
jgi:cytochrome o ubiquinol oxidase operon protein cyoD